MAKLRNPPPEELYANLETTQEFKARKGKPTRIKIRAPRVGLSKKLRFTVFSRDNFTCRYCGRQADEVKLVIDHITPVCQGGTNEETNLITSCEPCNQGKAGRTIGQAAPTENDRMRLLQEHREQLAVHESALNAAKRRDEFRQALVNQWCRVFGSKEVKNSTVARLVSLANEHGAETLFSWFDIAGNHFTYEHNEIDALRYVYGIRRKQSEHQRIANASKVS